MSNQIAIPDEFWVELSGMMGVNADKRQIAAIAARDAAIEERKKQEVVAAIDKVCGATPETLSTSWNDGFNCAMYAIKGMSCLQPSKTPIRARSLEVAKQWLTLQTLDFFTPSEHDKLAALLDAQVKEWRDI